jgi:hypothetical protein
VLTYDSRRASAWRTFPERARQAETVFLRVLAQPQRLALSPVFVGPLVRANGPPFCGHSLVDSFRLSSLREFAIVLYGCDCSQPIPSRSTTHARREQLCRVIGHGRCGFIWCEFLTVTATPFTAPCGLTPSLLAEATASTVRHELAKTGGLSRCHRQLRPNHRDESWSSVSSLLRCRGVTPSGRMAYQTFGLGGR